MPFNFNNIFSTLTQFNQFKDQFLKSGKDPRAELERELKARNITPEQLNELVNTAKQLSNLFGVHS